LILKLRGNPGSQTNYFQFFKCKHHLPEYHISMITFIILSNKTNTQRTLGIQVPFLFPIHFSMTFPWVFHDFPQVHEHKFSMNNTMEWFTASHFLFEEKFRENYIGFFYSQIVAPQLVRKSNKFLTIYLILQPNHMIFIETFWNDVFSFFFFLTKWGDIFGGTMIVLWL
jgi:hypothetical protein